MAKRNQKPKRKKKYRDSNENITLRLKSISTSESKTTHIKNSILQFIEDLEKAKTPDHISNLSENASLFLRNLMLDSENPIIDKELSKIIGNSFHKIKHMDNLEEDSFKLQTDPQIGLRDVNTGYKIPHKKNLKINIEIKYEVPMRGYEYSQSTGIIKIHPRTIFDTNSEPSLNMERFVSQATHNIDGESVFIIDIIKLVAHTKKAHIITSENDRYTFAESLSAIKINNMEYTDLFIVSLTIYISSVLNKELNLSIESLYRGPCITIQMANNKDGLYPSIKEIVKIHQTECVLDIAQMTVADQKDIRYPSVAGIGRVSKIKLLLPVKEGSKESLDKITIIKNINK